MSNNPNNWNHPNRMPQPLPNQIDDFGMRNRFGMTELPISEVPTPDTWKPDYQTTFPKADEFKPTFKDRFDPPVFKPDPVFDPFYTKKR